MKTMGTPASPARGITSWFKGKQINGKEGGRGYTPIKQNEAKAQHEQGQAGPHRGSLRATAKKRRGGTKV